MTNDYFSDLKHTFLSKIYDKNRFTTFFIMLQIVLMTYGQIDKQVM